jgi:hypothetical protein
MFHRYRRDAVLALVVWECMCGCKVKIMYDTDGRTTVRCPKPACKVTHVVDGKINHLWTEEGGRAWIDRDFLPLIVANA